MEHNAGGSQAQYHGLDRMTKVPSHFDLLWCRSSECIAGYSQFYAVLRALPSWHLDHR